MDRLWMTSHVDDYFWNKTRSDGKLYRLFLNIYELELMPLFGRMSIIPRYMLKEL